MTLDKKPKNLTKQDLKEVSLNYLKYIASQKNLGKEGEQLIKNCKLEIEYRLTKRPINRNIQG
tara:strand:+ start:1690 stop:1878 length:189 start_codon:yes stop_codon:yes gene_type:complete